MRNLVSVVVLSLAALITAPVVAADMPTKSVADVYKDKITLADKTINITGKVVKVNNSIMGRNWVHIQDGTGDAKNGSNDLLITSQDVAQVGQQINVSGKVAINRDFGAGYAYQVLIEEAKISVK